MRQLAYLLLVAGLAAATAWWFARREPLVAPHADGAETTEAAPEPVRAPLESSAAAPERAPAPSKPTDESRDEPRGLRGRVVDSVGQPVADDVDVLVLDERGERLERDSVDGDGRFVFASLPPGAATIEPLKDGWFARERVALDGAAELELVLERGGRIEGSLVLDPVRGARGVSVIARAENGVEHRRYGTIEPDGRFVIEGLEAGIYRFELVSDGEGMPVGALYSIPSVRVRREETTRDPRLFGLAIESLVRQVRLTVVDTAGTPIEGAMAFVLDVDLALLGRARVPNEGLALAVPAERVVEALITHEDFQPARLQLLREEELVVLAGGIRLTLRPQLPVPLDRGTHGAFLRLRPEIPELAGLPEGAFDVELPLHFGSEPTTEITFPARRHLSPARDGPGAHGHALRHVARRPARAARRSPRRLRPRRRPRA